MNKYLVVVALALVVAGCKTEQAPEISDVKNIVIDGTKYTAQNYIKQFCQFEGSKSDANCNKAEEQRVKDQSKFQAVPW